MNDHWLKDTDSSITCELMGNGSVSTTTLQDT
jgi:hypothetical protein